MVKQYDIFRAGRHDANVAYVIVLQSGDISALKTAIAAPLRKIDRKDALKILHIPVMVEGETFHISMAELAAFPLKQLGAFVENKGTCHTDVMAAVDLLFAGF